ncbi:hypothetical protein P152DRAFT_456897 [Eremomyces bilateralis CBS 781.70]|uniref:Multiple myeloma tumor-associated protein 2-like N-terminal domain-containing protein n=1 Tax=Eremomyces bilateralis CBS 781.70 TaxID=1392243 RepID=A0A6G1G9L0_9PEZI|nr:uncharacterized protein P152DRAFT_456897 [Eremomyces bilateralis CBS 781.70]KAF1814626.1 hypothetical protein P152DRAFT_456897 [Eremomyces bilateralis CBS 781.70]
MDLLQTIRKEGSRGGRAEFKWEDVKNDAQRENYLGHSLMARTYSIPHSRYPATNLPIQPSADGKAAKT